jgi:hypothetical protein
MTFIAMLFDDSVLRSPTTGIPGCCARTANGHATAALPSNDMNSRRFIISWCLQRFRTKGWHTSMSQEPVALRDFCPTYMSQMGHFRRSQPMLQAFPCPQHPQ